MGRRIVVHGELSGPGKACIGEVVGLFGVVGSILEFRVGSGDLVVSLGIELGLPVHAFREGFGGVLDDLIDMAELAIQPIFA